VPAAITELTHRQRVIRAVAGELLEEIPCLQETPMDPTVMGDMLPASTGDPVRDAIRRAEFFGNSVLSVEGVGLARVTLSRDESHHCYRYETGRRGGRFFPRTESGIPPMGPEKIRAYLDALRTERARGYCG
jgi:hypothetical protein